METTEKTIETPAPVATKKTLRIAHEELMKEENIKFEDLPKDIRKNINGFNLQRKSLEKKYSENLFKNLQEITVEIADKIQDIIENNLPDEPPAEETKPV